MIVEIASVITFGPLGLFLNTLRDEGTSEGLQKLKSVGAWAAGFFMKHVFLKE